MSAAVPLPSFDTLHSRRASSTRAFASMRMSSPSNRSRRTRRRLSTHGARSRHCRLLARAPEPQRSPGPNSSEPRLLGVDLLALLFARGGAGWGRRDACMALPPATPGTRRFLFEHLLDPPCATGLVGALRLYDDAVSDPSAHLSSSRFVSGLRLARAA